jgi:hypothetical protein
MARVRGEPRFAGLRCAFVSAADGRDKKERRSIGVLGWLVLLSLAFVGAWVVFGNAYDWARPWWRYATVASIAFTVGTFYGRFRRYEHDEKRKSRP